MKRFPVRIQRAVLWVSVLAGVLGLTVSLMAGTRPTDVTADQARALIQQRAGQPGFVVLDVRTPEEFAQGRLPGALDVNVLAPDFEARVGRLDRGKTYLVYCRTGNRSTRAVQIMERLGFRSMYHMVDGIVGWQKTGFPLSREP